MHFVTSLPIFINWKNKTYDSILVIIDWLTKVVYYKLVKISLNTPNLAEVIMDVVMK